MYKFRAKAIENFDTHIDGVEIGEWVYGYYYFDRADMCGIIVTELQEESGGVGSGIVQVHIRVDDKTVGKSTNLFDKNKKEIFEGDIVKIIVEETPFASADWQYYHHVENGIGKVVFDEGSFQVKKGIHEYFFKMEISANELEIIGNIYQNPELLKG